MYARKGNTRRGNSNKRKTSKKVVKPTYKRRSKPTWKKKSTKDQVMDIKLVGLDTHEGPFSPGSIPTFNTNRYDNVAKNGWVSNSFPISDTRHHSLLYILRQSPGYENMRSTFKHLRIKYIKVRIIPEKYDPDTSTSTELHPKIIWANSPNLVTKLYSVSGYQQAGGNVNTVPGTLTSVTETNLGNSDIMGIVTGKHLHYTIS